MCKMLLENGGWGRIMDMRVNERIANIETRVEQKSQYTKNDMVTSPF